MPKNRDITKTYPISSFVQKLRRLANGLSSKKQFTIQVKGERIRVPKGAKISIEHERSKGIEELEFQIVWKPTKNRP